MYLCIIDMKSILMFKLEIVPFSKLNSSAVYNTLPQYK